LEGETRLVVPIMMLATMPTCSSLADENHPDVKGCDYGLVAVSSALHQEDTKTAEGLYEGYLPAAEMRNRILSIMHSRIFGLPRNK